MEIRTVVDVSVKEVRDWIINKVKEVTGQQNASFSIEGLPEDMKVQVIIKSNVQKGRNS